MAEEMRVCERVSVCVCVCVCVLEEEESANDVRVKAQICQAATAKQELVAKY